jgi:hypothetical protein
MTDGQFETLRQELRAMRGDFDQRFDGVETRLTKLEVQLDSKPDKAFVFQRLLTVNATFIALIGLAILIFRSFLLPV